ncbi:MAG: hypothetical protein HUU20_26435 [Pirellulales bacterium]|nr:hypothetical protein [Pirellulales bacterium]
MTLYPASFRGSPARFVQTFSVMACTLFLAASSGDAEPLTSMPPYPTDSKDYLGKWDPFSIASLTGAKETLSRNNGRQIARDSAGTWFVLIERDQQAVYLGRAVKEPAKGCDFDIVELVGPSPQAVFQSEGNVQGASMVIDREDNLHVVWCASGAMVHVGRNVKNIAPPQLREKSAWTEAKRLAEPPCRPGDILLDAAGQAAVCYAREDTIYYVPLAVGKPEPAAGLGAGMEPLVMPLPAKQEPKDYDPARPPAAAPKTPSYPPPRPLAERQCSEAVMDLGPDGSVHLAFQRDFDIWYARRTPDGRWQRAERAAWGLAFHPAILVADGRPLVCFQYEGIRKVALGDSEYLAKREGGGASIGYAVKTDLGWQSDYLARAEEIIVNRQGTWDKRYEGKLVPMVEEMWRPVLFRDRHGVAWALWQNTTRRWAYSARWLGESFGEVHECRGPFCAPGQPVSAEKLMPPDAADLGLLFFAAQRVIFDRMKVPALSLAEDREVLFLDSLEVGRVAGLQFVLNPMAKHPANPVLSPGPLGSKDDRHVFTGRVAKRGDKYVLWYSHQSWADSEWKTGALAVSSDGVAWRKVDAWPEDLPRGDGLPAPTDPVVRGYFDNPDSSDASKRFMRIHEFGEVWYKGSKRVVYSPDGRNWSDGPEVSVLNAIFEGGTPNLWDPLDPERPIKIYGRVFSSNSRSCGMMWSKDLLHWEGAEHYLDPDDPYGKPPGNPSTGPLRGQIFLDASAGKGEDQIYSCQIRVVDGLYLCIYWPCSFEHRYDGALAVSRDGLNFTRVKNGGRTLPVGPAGSWDSGIVKLGWPERDGDILRDYYGGGAWHHGVEPYRPSWHIGLATIRVNGWTYYTPAPGADRGSLTTIPIVAPEGVQKSLAVNVENLSGKAGALAVEVLDAATGQPLSGFTAADCIPPASDGLAARVAWKGGKHVPAGKPVRLRFDLVGPGVRLYSFAFQGP